MPGAKDELALLPVPNPSSASSTEPAPNQATGASETASATQADGTLPFMPMEAPCTARSFALHELAVYVSAAAITYGSTSANATAKSATATATRAVSTASTNVVAPSKSIVPFLGSAGPRLSSLSVGVISGFGVVVLGMILFEQVSVMFVS